MGYSLVSETAEMAAISTVLGMIGLPASQEIFVFGAVKWYADIWSLCGEMVFCQHENSKCPGLQGVDARNSFHARAVRSRWTLGLGLAVRGIYTVTFPTN